MFVIVGWPVFLVSVCCVSFSMVVSYLPCPSFSSSALLSILFISVLPPSFSAWFLSIDFNPHPGVYKPAPPYVQSQTFSESVQRYLSCPV